MFHRMHARRSSEAGRCRRWRGTDVDGSQANARLDLAALDLYRLKSTLHPVVGGVDNRTPTWGGRRRS